MKGYASTYIRQIAEKRWGGRPEVILLCALFKLRACIWTPLGHLTYIAGQAGQMINSGFTGCRYVSLHHPGWRWTSVAKITSENFAEEEEEEEETDAGLEGTRPHQSDLDPEVLLHLHRQQEPTKQPDWTSFNLWKAFHCEQREHG